MPMGHLGADVAGRGRSGGRYSARRARCRTATPRRRSVSAEPAPDLAEVVDDEQDARARAGRPGTARAGTSTARIERRDDGQDDGDLEDELDDVAVEERLDGEVGAEQDDDRQRRRQDPEPDDDRERGDEQPDAERGPCLAEGPPAGDRRRLGLGRRGGGGPADRRAARPAGRPAARRPAAIAASSSTSCDARPSSRASPSRSSVGARRRGSASRPAVSRMAATSGSSFGQRRRPARRPRRSPRPAPPSAPRSAPRGPAIACDGGATLSRPANPSGSCHDWRTEPVRVYFGPAGARSPANRSPVSRPHRPR